MEHCDVVVIGCGPGGTTAAAQLARRGRHVIALEKAGFPRYHIGESLTGTVATYLRREGLAGRMSAHAFPVKQGVKVVGRGARQEFFVAAAPEPTWQVRRDEFDQLLLDHAVACGAEHRRGTVTGPLRDGERVCGVRYVDAEGASRTLRAPYVVDASGPATLLSARGVASERVRDAYSDQVAVFTQLADCRRDPGVLRDNTLIFYGEPHHWAWFIPLTDRIVSVGIVVTRATYKRLGQEVMYTETPIPHRVLAWGMRHLNPDLWERCRDCPRVEPVRVIRDYSYAVERYTGDGWVCVGDAHRFVDPIFSFGVALAIHEGELAAEAIDEAMTTGSTGRSFARYAQVTRRGQDAVADVIRYFWRFPAFFGVQARGRFREDIMKLFAGACYDDPPLPGLVMMRESLAAG